MTKEARDELIGRANASYSELRDALLAESMRADNAEIMRAEDFKLTAEALDQRDKAIAERDVIQTKLQTERVMRLTYEGQYREIKEGSDQALMMLQVSDVRSAIEILRRFE